MTAASAWPWLIADTARKPNTTTPTQRQYERNGNPWRPPFIPPTIRPAQPTVGYVTLNNPNRGRSPSSLWYAPGEATHVHGLSELLNGQGAHVAVSRQRAVRIRHPRPKIRPIAQRCCSETACVLG